ncbi:hypothetical protein VTO42DRAFT_5532 [Malbranchea cinnamomea]
MTTPRKSSQIPVLVDQSFRFTPRGPLSRAPRLWDRKPTAPANPFSRNREVWKRVLFPRRDDKTRKMGSVGTQDRMDERGVKRMRIERGAGKKEPFVETKWEGNGEEGRGRKFPTLALTGDQTDGHGDSVMPSSTTGSELEQEGVHVPAGVDTSECQHTTTLGSHRTETQSTVNGNTDSALDLKPSRYGNDDHGFFAEVPTTSTQCNSIPVSVPPPTRRDSKHAFTPSRLRYQGLEGDLAEVLSDFLSKAKAKREANTAALVVQNSENIIITSNDSKTKQPLPQSPRTQARRALGDLDKNSPSPARSPLFPSKSLSFTRPEVAMVQEKLEMSENPRMTEEKLEHKGEREQDSAELETNVTTGTEVDGEEATVDQSEAKSGVEVTSLTGRERRASPKKKRSPPKIRTINLRRATGNEFVFQRRTEAQQLALTTKANTRKNKGGAKLPHLVLPELQAKALEEKEKWEGEMKAAADGKEDETSLGKRKREAGKHVHWDEDNLVSYYEEPEEQLLSLEDVGLATPTRRSSRRKLTNDPSTKEGGEEESKVPLPLFSPSVTRKVRRLGSTKKKGLKGDVVRAKKIKA